MTLSARIAAFQVAFAKWPASWPWLTSEQGRDVLYGIWVIGNDYRNKTKFYGSYPPGFLERVMALFPDNRAAANVLHVFSGSLPQSAFYTRLDCRADLGPDLHGSVYDVAALVMPTGHRFHLVIADPPYSSKDAEQYGTPMIDRHRATKALAQVTAPGGHLVWLDTVWPMHNKTEWLTVGRILVQRSTNHRARVLSIFERVAA